MGWKQWQRFCNWQKALVKEMQERWMENLGSRVELGTWLGITGCVAEAGEWFSSVDDGNRDPPRETRGWGWWSGAGMQAVNLGLCRLPLRHL